MKFTEDSVPPYRTAGHAVSNEETLRRGIAETSKQFIKTIAEVHAKA